MLEFPHTDMILDRNHHQSTQYTTIQSRKALKNTLHTLKSLYFTLFHYIIDFCHL